MPREFRALVQAGRRPVIFVFRRADDVIVGKTGFFSRGPSTRMQSRVLNCVQDSRIAIVRASAYPW
jgi:hypothetical protein